MTTKTPAAKKSAQSNTQESSAASATSVDGDRMVRLLLTLLEVDGDTVKRG